MPWIKIMCKCEKPPLTEIRKEKIGPGSVWQCPNEACKTLWVFQPGRQGPLGPAWFLAEKVEDEQTPLRTE